jgi:acetyl esterase/lipase
MKKRGLIKAMIPILFVPLAAFAAPAVSQNDVPYGDHPRQRLDMHWPDSPPAGFATVIFIHGGSLESGDKSDEDYRDVWKPFPAVGIACATINYRLAADASWPAQAEDCAAAVAWIRRAVSKRGGDVRRIFVVGHSSGATLAALLGTDRRFLEAQGMKPRDLAGIVPMGSIRSSHRS